MSGPIVVLPLDPRNIDVKKCAHTTEGEHHCVHDWRIYWGNPARQEGG